MEGLVWRGHLRKVVVTETDQVVYITGEVRNYYHKQIAQEMVRQRTKKRIMNQLIVALGKDGHEDRDQQEK